KECAQIRETASQYRRNIHSTQNSQPASATNLRQTKFQFVTGSHKRRVSRRQRRDSNVHVEFATAPGDDSLILETQLQTAESNFESRGAVFIANEQIRHAQRK